MTALGRGVSLWLVVFVVLAAAGMAGTTIVHQDSAQEIHDQNDALREENERLRERVNESEADLRTARARADELETELETRSEDVDALVAKLERVRARLNATRATLAQRRERTAGKSTKRLDERLTVLCAQEENEDKYACAGYGDGE